MSLFLAFSKEISHSEKVMYGCFDDTGLEMLNGGVGSSESDYCHPIRVRDPSSSCLLF